MGYGITPYTIGQRKGLGVYLTEGVHNGPWYVVSKDYDNNIVFCTN